MTHLDPHLRQVDAIVRPGLPYPLIIETLEPVGPARIREAEAAGIIPRFGATLVPQIHGDLPAGQLKTLEKAGFAAAFWYDHPVYATALMPEEAAKATPNPFRSSKADIEARLAERVSRTSPRHSSGSHLRSYLGLQGPVSIPHGSGLYTLEDARIFTNSKAIYDSGATGRGVTVAVLDTGADPGHPMLEGRIKQAKSFVEEDANTDLQGHGSWCSSAIAGKRVQYHGKTTELDGQELQGMSEADLLVGKVLTGEGTGALSGIVAGVEWAVERGARIISMSLGSLFDLGGLGPDAQAVDAATEKGVNVVCANGNQFLLATVGSPASARGAIAIGSCAMRYPAPGATSTFSSKGPTKSGSIRPHISAPGGNTGRGMEERILGAAAGVTAAESADQYALLAGTSMATPIVAGILAQAIPLGFPKERQRVEEVLAMGVRSGPTRPLGGALAAKDNRTGWGVIDAVRLLDAIGRHPPPLVQLAAQAHQARNRPMLGAAAALARGLRSLPSPNRDVLRLTML